MKKRVILAASLLFCIELAAAEVSVYFEERAPYVTMENGKLGGIVGSGVQKAFEGSKIAFKYAAIPAKRQLAAIEASNEAVCGVGWFKNPQREAFALFSNPLYKDKPTALLIRKNDARFETLQSVAELAQNDKLTILVKGGYSYGQFLDETIKSSKLKQTQTFEDNQKMAELIASNRADFMFVAQEEAQLLIGAQKDFLAIKSLNDMPQGNKRYLMCSKKVDPSTVQALNNFIDFKE